MNEKIQVLCATMHQTDFSKLNEMNINNCDVIFANQDKRFLYEEQMINNHVVQMITTDTIGVGKNRNFALAISSGDILVFADDDLIYDDDFTLTVENEFNNYSDADMIVFGLRYAKKGKVFKKRVPKSGKLIYTKALRYGTCSFVVRRSSILKNNLRFTELFGGGCLYSYGEDTDFITQCFKAGMKIYASNKIIATTNKDSSTCFSGYGKKFYYDKGALARHSMGIFALPYILKMSFKKMDSELSILGKMRYMCSGYKGFSKLISYDEWDKNKR